MKTWIFDEEKLDMVIAQWVEAQIATGHPKAIKNAAFVGRAVKDLLLSNDDLYKDAPVKSHNPSSVSIPNAPAKAAANGQTETEQRVEKSDNAESGSESKPLSIQELKDLFYGD